MAWKEMTLEEVARSLGVSISEVREKHRLIQQIVKARKAMNLSQAALAKKIGVSQARIAQVESGIGTAQVTFDILFNILETLGYRFHVIVNKAA